ncbi:unnamed protein product, partial [Cyprideis torosa]
DPRAVQAVSAATEDQAKEAPAVDAREEEEEKEKEEDVRPEEEGEDKPRQQKEGERREGRKQSTRPDQPEEQEDEVLEIPGETVPTCSVERPLESYHETRKDLIMEIDLTEDNDDLEIEVLKEIPSDRNACSSEHVAAWRQLEEEVRPLASALCEQLRLVLEPSVAARLKGDYKTGKRLNMRK